MKHKKPDLIKIRITFADRIFFLGVTLLILVAAGVFQLYTTTTEKKQIEVAQFFVENTSANQKYQLENFVSNRLEILQALSSYPEIYEMDSKKQAEFLRGRSENFGFRDIFIMDSNGIGFYINENVYRNQKDETFFSDIMNNDVFITKPFYYDDGKAFMTFCVSIYNNGEKVGALCGTVNLSTLQNLIINSQLPLDADCFIVSREGNYITSAQNGKIKEGTLIYNDNNQVELIQQAFDTQTNCNGIIVLDNKECLADIFFIPDFNWVIVYCVPIDSIVAQHKNMIILHNIIIVAALLLIGFFIRLTYRWAKSERIAYTDALTKCHNKAAYNKMIAHLNKDYSDDISIMFMDLNKFKVVNDTYGHDKGDNLLIMFSQALREVFDDIGFIARVGGDEFVIILLNVSQEEIEQRWNTLTNNLQDKSKTLDFPYVITSSYGYASRNKGDTTDLTSFTKNADKKMYEHKHGKN